MPPAIANAAVLIPWAVAILSPSPTSPLLPELATSTNTASPTAAPTPELVETIPEATPCSRSVTPVAAAMNIVVNTTPSPMLMRDETGDERGIGAVWRYRQTHRDSANCTDGERGGKSALDAEARHRLTCEC